MNKITLPSTTLSLGFLLVILHTLALTKSLYFHVPWLDVGMHFLGGLFLALLGILILKKFKKYFLSISSTRLVIDILLFTFIIGIIWEIYELNFGLIFAKPDAYVLDTVADLFMGTLGSVLGLYLVINNKFKII